MRHKARIVLAFALTTVAALAASYREHFRRLGEHFDDDAIIELTGLIAFKNLSSKFNAALEVKPQGFCSATPQPETTKPKTRQPSSPVSNSPTDAG